MPFVSERLETVPPLARKLFALIASKTEAVVTPPGILEACGLDVGEFYSLLTILSDAGLIQVANSYPFEEIQLSPEAAQELARATE
jgi:hypothetical protein